MKNFLRRIFIGGITGVVAVLIVWILANVVFESFFYRFEASTYDYRVRKIIEPPSHLIEDVVIVDIDNRSLNELGALNQWPRTYWAKALEILQRGGARMVAFDIIFDHSRRFPEEDQQFIQQIADHGNVISSISLEVADPDRFLNPMSEEPEGLNWEKFSIEVPDNLAFRLFTFDRMEPHFPQLHNASAQIGAVNFSLDVDGISRRLPLFLRFNEHVYPTLAAAMALQKLDAQNILYDEETQEIQIQSQNGQTISVPVDEKGRALIYFHGPFQTFRYIPFSSLLKEEVPVDYFNDKVVLFGSSAPGLYDLRSIPWQPTFPGVEIHANFFHQIVNQRFIEEMTAGNEFLYILIVGVICGVLFTLFRPRGGIITSIVMAILIFTVAWVAFSAQLLWLPLLTPFLTVLLTFTIHYTYRYTVEEHDKRAIKKVFSHYLSSKVVDELLENPSMIKLGGEKKECTVMFADLVGFTSLAEDIPPEELVKLLNEYLTAMTHLILESDGTLDKYEGDAIMAIFGAPVDIDNHALKACQAALNMQKKLEDIRKSWKIRNLPEFHQRTGIDTGPMIVGNMGSDIRFDYTAIGDHVNLGARLESANKLYGSKILISEDTYTMAREQVIGRQLDLLRVSGRKKPVKVFELMAMKNDSLPVKTREILKYFHQGYQHYLAQNWDGALNQFRQALQIDGEDGPSRLYLLRCQEFAENPPGSQWDGVYTLKSK